MSTPPPTLDLHPVLPPTVHPAPTLSHPSLIYTYTPSPSSITSNLLILFHGLGDTHLPFSTLGKSLNLPQTAVLSLRGPERVPLLEEEAWSWWMSFDPLGELTPSPNPSSTLTLLRTLLDHLTSTTPGSPSWHPSQIHLFGYAQGGTCAAEFALSLPSSSPSLGSIVSISAPLLSHPTSGNNKKRIKVLLVCRKGEERMVGGNGWKRGFEDVKEVVLGSGRGDGMLRGEGEWREVMRFWSMVLARRSPLESGEGVYSVGGGAEAAYKAGVRPPTS